jgi:hypothetical protein
MAGVSKIAVIIDANAVANACQPATTGFFWIPAIQRMFQSLRDRGVGTVVKVILVGYGPAAPGMGNRAEFSDVFIETGGKGLVGTSRKRSAKWQLASASMRRGVAGTGNRRGNFDLH